MLQMDCYMKDPGLVEKVNLNVGAIGHNYQVEPGQEKYETDNALHSKVW